VAQKAKNLVMGPAASGGGLARNFRPEFGLQCRCSSHAGMALPQGAPAADGVGHQVVPVHLLGLSPSQTARRDDGDLAYRLAW
jgi:hypothetical protein